MSYQLSAWFNVFVDSITNTVREHAFPFDSDSSVSLFILLCLPYPASCFIFLKFGFKAIEKGLGVIGNCLSLGNLRFHSTVYRTKNTGIFFNVTRANCKRVVTGLAGSCYSFFTHGLRLLWKMGIAREGLKNSLALFLYNASNKHKQEVSYGRL